MCGIAGVNFHPRDEANANRLSDALLKELEIRGRDATGSAWVTPDDETWFHKLPVRSSLYTSQVPARVRSMILHTRMATHGNPSDNVNNHPIVLPGIVGVHNGIVSNYAQLFTIAGAEPTSEVDSEGIFALLNSRQGHPADILGEVDGNAAIAWLETEQPHLLRLARLEGRPLFIATTTTGSTIFGSTESIIRKACQRASVRIADKSMWEVPEWTYLRLRDGKLIECCDIPHFTYTQPTAVSPWTQQEIDEWREQRDHELLGGAK